ncbi:MAG TPA: hypothetical protein VGB85_29015, partial [Nannocystis sp.]
MKMLVGLMAFLALGVMFSQIAVSRFGVSPEDARLLLYVITGVWMLGMIIMLVRWIIARRQAAAKNAKPIDPAVLVLRKRTAEARAALDQLARQQKAVAPKRPWLVTAPYATPWLAVLGLPQHGKTALLGPISGKRLVEVDQEGPRKGP